MAEFDSTNGDPRQWEPIDGVTLETCAAIIRELGARNSDQALLLEIAASHGVTALRWGPARDGWGARIKVSPSLGAKFNQLYAGT